MNSAVLTPPTNSTSLLWKCDPVTPNAPLSVPLGWAAVAVLNGTILEVIDAGEFNVADALKTHLHGNSAAVGLSLLFVKVKSDVMNWSLGSLHCRDGSGLSFSLDVSGQFSIYISDPGKTILNVTGLAGSLEQEEIGGMLRTHIKKFAGEYLLQAIGRESIAQSGLSVHSAKACSEIEKKINEITGGDGINVAGLTIQSMKVI